MICCSAWTRFRRKLFIDHPWDYCVAKAKSFEIFGLLIPKASSAFKGASSIRSQ